MGINTGWGENLKCTKYDTQSERAGIVLLTGDHSSYQSDKFLYEPYYTDAANKNNWKESDGSFDVLSDEHVAKLGCLYNWSAAVGLAIKSEIMDCQMYFNGQRQGICPNGWHIPNRAEWYALFTAIGGRDIAAKKLKTKSGWNTKDIIFEHDPDYNMIYTSGSDDYGFSALPAGRGYKSKISDGGGCAVFWTATTESNDKIKISKAYSCIFTFYYDEVNILPEPKFYAQSVRCIKNTPVTVPVVAQNSNHRTVTDCQGHTYPVVKIGNQYWMGENLQCTKYDTQSERAGAMLSTSGNRTYAPYYTDGRNVYTEDSGNLTSNQRKKLGLLYNWAAAVGLATESEAMSRTTSFSGRRQGICPNGWHIPTDAEWSVLSITLGGIKGSDSDIPNAVKFSDVGKKLKATSGWYNSGNGTDKYSFAALPAGFAGGSAVDVVGDYAFFWTVTPRNDCQAYICFLYYAYESLYSLGNNKGGAYSVRCVKD